MQIPNIDRKLKALANLVQERSSRVASKDFVLTRTELKKALGNNYLEILELYPFIQYTNSGWTSSSEVWQGNGRSLYRKDGTKANWKGKAKKFIITDHLMLQELLNTPIPVKAVDKKEQKKVAAAKKKANQRKLKALPEYQQLQIQELRHAWKKSGNKLKDFFFSVNDDGRYYSSVHSMSKEERTEAFVEKMGMREIDGKSFHLFILARQFFLETGNRSALDYVRSFDLYSDISQKLLSISSSLYSNNKKKERNNSFSSVSKNTYKNESIPRKTRVKGRTKKGTRLLAIPVSENTDHRERGKEILMHLTNAARSIPGTQEAFDALGLSKFYAFIQKLKKKSKKLTDIDGKKGLGIYCQEIEDKIIRQTIGKGLISKGFHFIDLHDGFYTNAPDDVLEAILLGLPEISFSDFKVKAAPKNTEPTSIQNEELPEAPEQIEATQLHPKLLKASDSLLLTAKPQRHNPFQALDELMISLGIEQLNENENSFMLKEGRQTI